DVDVGSDASHNGVRVILNGDVAQFDPGQITSVLVYSGDGNDTVNILRTIVPVTVDSAGTTTVNIGNNGSLAGILGRISLQNETPIDTVNVFGYNDLEAPAPLTAFVDTTPRGDGFHGS